MVKFIESELMLLKKEIDEMWTLVYNQIDRAGEAVLTMDRELAKQVKMRERRVNAFELKIDSDVEDIIALYGPVAVDLRFVLAILKMNTTLERIGDFAESIATFVLKSAEPVLNEQLIKDLRLEEMYKQVLGMLQLAKESLEKEDLDMASTVITMDDVLDEINHDATQILANYIVNNTDTVITYMELLNIIRKLERAGDHITNMAEEIVFFVDAKVLKHEGKTDESYQ